MRPPFSFDALVSIAVAFFVALGGLAGCAGATGETRAPEPAPPAPSIPAPTTPPAPAGVNPFAGARPCVDPDDVRAIEALEAFTRPTPGR